MVDALARRRGSARSVALVTNAADVLPALVDARLAPGPGHRSDVGPRPSRWVRPEWPLARRCAGPACQRSRRLRPALDRRHGGTRPGDARLPARPDRSPSTTATTSARGAGARGGERVRLPGLRARLHPAALLRGQGAIPLSRRCRATRPTSPPSTAPWPSCSRTTRGSSAGCASPRRRSRSRGFPPASAGSATATAQRPGCGSTSSSRRGEISAPIVIGRDHLDAGSVASPNRETEAMRDGSDAIADWPILNALVNTAAGATWVSFHHGGGVGIGFSLHAGMVVVADGTPEAARTPRARADLRSGHGRHPPRRCRLRPRPRGRRRARRAHPDAIRCIVTG